MRKEILFTVIFSGFGWGYQAYSQGDDPKAHHPNAKVEDKTDSESNMGDLCPDGMKSCPMMGQNCPMMQGDQAGMMHDLMHSDKVDLSVAEVDGGVTVKWTSSDKETAKKLKAMAQQMKKMHPMIKGPMGKDMMKKQMDGTNNNGSGTK